MHLLYKLHFMVTMQMIFPSKIGPHDHMIFLHRAMRHYLKGVCEFSQIFVGKKQRGCFGVTVKIFHFQGENEYFP